MASLNDRVLDEGLSAFHSESNRLDICDTEPTTYAQATSTYTLGNATGGDFVTNAPSARGGGGREVVIDAITNGSVTDTGTAGYWGITDTVNSRLLASGELASAQSVTSGNVFTLTSFAVGIPSVT